MTATESIIREVSSRLLTDRTYRFSLCVHEAAHGVYLRRAGFKSLIFHGPTVAADGDIGTAGIKADTNGETLSIDSMAIARWHCAALVTLPLLTNVTQEQSEVCAGRDIEQFPIYIRQLCPQITDEEITEHWREASDDVRRDLRRPEIRRDIYALAHEFEDWLVEKLTAAVPQ